MFGWQFESFNFNAATVACSHGGAWEFAATLVASIPPAVAPVAAALAACAVHRVGTGALSLSTRHVSEESGENKLKHSTPVVGETWSSYQQRSPELPLGVIAADPSFDKFGRLRKLRGGPGSEHARSPN